MMAGQLIGQHTMPAIELRTPRVPLRYINRLLRRDTNMVISTDLFQSTLQIIVLFLVHSRWKIMSATVFFSLTIQYKMLSSQLIVGTLWIYTNIQGAAMGWQGTQHLFSCWLLDHTPHQRTARLMTSRPNIVFWAFGNS